MNRRPRQKLKGAVCNAQSFVRLLSSFHSKSRDKSDPHYGYSQAVPSRKTRAHVAWKGMSVAWTVFLILMVIWALALATLNALGGLIHLLFLCPVHAGVRRASRALTLAVGVEQGLLEPLSVPTIVSVKLLFGRNARRFGRTLPRSL